MKFQVKHFPLVLITMIFSILFLFGLKASLTQLLAYISILLSLIIIIKHKENMYIIFAGLPIFYATYSIAIGEFIAKNLQVSINPLRTLKYELYEKSILIIIVFLISLIFFLKENKKNQANAFTFEDNVVLYTGLYILIILINIFFFDRSSHAGYVVRGTPIQGYTYILFMFLNYYSGNRPIRKNLSIILAILVSMQILAFGGRGSVIPIVVITMMTYFKNSLDFKKIIFFAGIGIIAFTLVGTHRSGQSVSVSSIVIDLSENLFVQDTSIMAFNSSVTHLAAAEFYNWGFRLQSFFAFILAIIFGGNIKFTELSNVTPIASRIYLNLGGGIMPSYFYFWLGWIGVILAGFILAKILNRGIYSKNRVTFLSVVTMIAGTTTWYLYSPLQLFRVTLVLVPILYFVLNSLDKIIKKNTDF